MRFVEISQPELQDDGVGSRDNISYGVCNLILFLATVLIQIRCPEMWLNFHMGYKIRATDEAGNSDVVSWDMERTELIQVSTISIVVVVLVVAVLIGVGVWRWLKEKGNYEK